MPSISSHAILIPYSENHSAPFSDRILMKHIKNFSTIKNNLIRLLAGPRQCAHLLERIPYRPFLDLYQIYACVLEDHFAVLSWSELNRWQVDLDTLDRYAAANSQGLLGLSFLPMENVLSKVLPEAELSPDSRLYVLTNDNHTFGASSILYPGLAASIGETFQGNYYLIPASVHELILIPERSCPAPSRLMGILSQINHTILPPEDFLSDTLYYFSREDGGFSVYNDDFRAGNGS